MRNIMTNDIDTRTEYNYGVKSEKGLLRRIFSHHRAEECENNTVPMVSNSPDKNTVSDNVNLNRNTQTNNNHQTLFRSSCFQ